MASFAKASAAREVIRRRQRLSAMADRDVGGQRSAGSLESLNNLTRFLRCHNLDIFVFLFRK